MLRGNMPVNVEVRENGRVIYFEIADPWTLEEMLAGFGKSAAMRDQLYSKNPEAAIHSFIDVHLVKNPPPLGSLRARQSPGLTHASRGEFVVFGANTLTRSLIEMMLKLAHFDKGRFVDDEAEAWAYIRQLIAADDNKSGSNG